MLFLSTFIILCYISINQTSRSLLFKFTQKFSVFFRSKKKIKLPIFHNYRTSTSLIRILKYPFVKKSFVSIDNSNCLIMFSRSFEYIEYIERRVSLCTKLFQSTNVIFSEKYCLTDHNKDGFKSLCMWRAKYDRSVFNNFERQVQHDKVDRINVIIRKIEYSITLVSILRYYIIFRGERFKIK